MWSVLVIALLFFVQQAWTQSCNPYFGPSGTTACVRIYSYNNQYQWATCLTDSYILQKSFQRHTCINQFAIYCWYQCMLEVHDKESGPVTSDCSCSPSSLPDPTLSPTTSLPSFCYSPSGTNCWWYDSCLKKKYPCIGTNNDDPLKYAEDICWLYNNRNSLFSADGRKWVDGVRKCLQVELVPLLRPWNKPTCQEIAKTAFESQVSCYMKPDEGVPSICDLDCKEYFKIFWVIKGYVIDVETVAKSLSGLWNIDDKCGSNSIRNCSQGGGKTLIKITKLTFQKFTRRGKRSFDSTPDETARRKFADGVALAIAIGLNWDTVVMDWFAYPDKVNTSDPTSLEMVMVLADKKALGIVTSSRPSFNLSQSLQQLSSAIEGATLPLQVDGYNVWVKSLSLCTDKSCNKTQTLANSDEPPAWPVPTTSQASDEGGPVTTDVERKTTVLPVPTTSQVSDEGGPVTIDVERKTTVLPVPTTSQVSDEGGPVTIDVERKTTVLPVPTTSQVSDEGGPVTIDVERKTTVLPVPTTSRVSDEGGPVSVEVKRKPAKRSSCVRISPQNVGMYGITVLVIMLMNKLAF